MASADTNVLVRLLVGDDPLQTPKAEAFLASQGPLWISVVVLLETAWVLGSVYGFKKPQILSAFRGLADSQDFTLQAQDSIRKALEIYAVSRADLPECLALELARAEGRLPLGTFDRIAGKLPGTAAL